MSERGERIKLFMRRVPQPVTVVTTRYNDRLYGITVSSFTSVSLEPPLILVCIHKGSESHDPLLKSGTFAVNLLRENQSWLSDRFAGFHRVRDKFENVNYKLHDKHGVPLIDDVLAWIVCRLWRSYDGGDHTIIVGEVIDYWVSDGAPLVYWMRGYRSLKL